MTPQYHDRGLGQHQRGAILWSVAAMTRNRDHDLTTVHGRLRYLITQQGTSEAEIVSATKLSQSTVNAALIGARKNPRLSTIKPIADFLGADPIWIMRGDGEPHLAANLAIAKKAAEEAIRAAGVPMNSAKWHEAMAAANRLIEAAAATRKLR